MRSRRTARFGPLSLLLACAPSGPGGQPAGTPVASVPGAASSAVPTPSAIPTAVVDIPPASSAATSGDAAAPEPLGVDRTAALWNRYLSAEDPRVLYTWTTPEQLAELKNGAPFLSRDRSPTMGHAVFDHLLSHLAHRPRGMGSYRDLATTLFREGFAKKRFAWHTAFGAALGLGGKPFGSVLVRVVLKPGAVRCNLLDQSLVVAGSHKAAADLAQFPERLGVVYYKGDGYQELVLPNESMIEEVSANTDMIRRELADELTFLESLTERDVQTRSLAAAFASKPPGSLRVVEAYVVALRQYLAAMPSASFVRRLTAPFVLGNTRPALPPFCRETSRKKVRTGDVSFAQTIVSIACAPTNACEAFEDACRPKPEAFR